MMRPGEEVVLDVEKPAAGGRMLARHEGLVVLVAAAIPGERVRARVERVGKGVVFAETTEVVSASPDRRPVEGDWRCGGSVFLHVAYPRQVLLKAEIMRDALTRIARLEPPPGPVDVMPSPESGYRMRARLHVGAGRVGFYREGTHQICAAGPTRQLSAATLAWLEAVAPRVVAEGGIAAVDVAENVPATERACHLEALPGADRRRVARLQEELGLARRVTDTVDVGGGGQVTLSRDARAFFQGNRFLLGPLVRHVLAQAGEAPVVDLYAGVGLFGLAAAAAGVRSVTLVEGDETSAADLQRNARGVDGVRVVRSSVEDYLRQTPGGVGGTQTGAVGTVLVDPPRTGLTPLVVEQLLRLRPRRLVYVSCDVATFARDARALAGGGYRLGDLRGFDLFPNTAHVESVGTFTPAG